MTVLFMISKQKSSRPGSQSFSLHHFDFIHLLFSLHLKAGSRKMILVAFWLWGSSYKSNEKFIKTFSSTNASSLLLTGRKRFLKQKYIFLIFSLLSVAGRPSVVVLWIQPGKVQQLAGPKLRNSKTLHVSNWNSALQLLKKQNYYQIAQVCHLL